MRRIFFIIIVLVFFHNEGWSQEIKRSSFFIEETLDHTNFPENSHGRKIISLLASNNVKSLNWVELKVRANMIVQLFDAEVGRVAANLILTNHTLSGETFFRDFLVDSLLMPDIIEGRVILFEKDQKLVSRPWLLASRSGRVDMHLPDSISFTDEGLKAEIRIDRMLYSDERFASFIWLTELINSYYSYSTVLEDLVDTFRKNDLSKNQPPSRLLVSWEQIRRVNNNAAKFDFSGVLPLTEHDPRGYLPLYQKSKRIEKRANTLVSWIVKSNIKGVVSDKQTFCSNYVGLSGIYFDKAANHQPYIASGFNDIARVYPDSIGREMILRATDMFDIFDNLDMPATQQLIYDQFVELAVIYAEASNHVSAMLLLNNAEWFQSAFDEVERTTAYTEIYLKVLDGLMSSYLTVAIMAYQSGSFDMAEKYHEKAKTLYDNHRRQFAEEEILTSSLINFSKQQVDLAYFFINDSKYRDALRLLDEAKQINAEMHAEPENGKLDHAYIASHQGVMQDKLDSLLVYIDLKSSENALEALEEVKSYSAYHHQYLNGEYDTDIVSMAKILFVNYFNKGERLLRSQHAEQALFSFLEAQEINNVYVHQPNEKLDSLIYVATVPVILAITEKAEFETWANGMDQAYILYEEAITLQDNYKQQDNPEINAAILALKIKMDDRVCVNLSNDCFALQKQVENRISSKKYLEAKIILDSALSIIKQNRDCEIDDSGLLQIQKLYADAFHYVQVYEQMEQKLDGEMYDQVIELYLSLVQEFKTKNIERFGIEKPGLTSYVTNQNQAGLSISCCNYYVHSHQYNEAFNNLLQLKKQNINPKEVRDLQELIGKGKGEEDKTRQEDKKILLDQYTGNDKWFRYFRSAYLGSQ